MPESNDVSSNIENIKDYFLRLSFQFILLGLLVYLVVFVNHQIDTNELLLATLILIVIIGQRFQFIKIAGLVELGSEVKEIKEELHSINVRMSQYQKQVVQIMPLDVRAETSGARSPENITYPDLSSLSPESSQLTPSQPPPQPPSQ
jgi:hypothetical protein